MHFAAFSLCIFPCIMVFFFFFFYTTDIHRIGHRRFEFLPHGKGIQTKIKTHFWTRVSLLVKKSENLSKLLFEKGLFLNLKEKDLKHVTSSVTVYLILLMHVSSHAILWPLYCFTSQQIVTQKKRFFFAKMIFLLFFFLS